MFIILETAKMCHGSREPRVPRTKQNHQENKALGASKGGVIEDEVWIGVNSVILDGPVIRKGCAVGTLSLVTGGFAEYGVHARNPIMKLGERR
jgi:acetyltransferase-like isoleucine patch superfamily enzyme